MWSFIHLTLAAVALAFPLSSTATPVAMATTNPFSTLPSNATSVKPYALHVPDADLKLMHDLLRLGPVAGPLWENSRPDGNRSMGLRRDWLIEAKRVLETEFNWRETEARINSFPNFQVAVDDDIGSFTIHFAALFSTRPDAVPIVLLHGWPGSFLEFLPMLELFREKYTAETLPYHLIVPSLPGFTISSTPPVGFDITQIDAARIMNTVMEKIGFGSGYVAQGGDVGSRVARIMAVDHAACKAVHLNFCSMSRPASLPDDTILSAMEQAGLKRWEEDWKVFGTAYAMEHATKPSTIGFVLSSSPLAVLSWIGEKLQDWTDNPLSLNTILESCALYWLTKSAHSSIWSYRHSFGAHPIPHDDPRYHITVPFGYSYFAREIIPMPIAWVATTGNLVWSASHERGGHFAAWEQPAQFMADLEAFVGQFWGKTT